MCDNKNLVIRPADKGGGIVLLDKTDYMNEMYHILSDHDTYKGLPNNPTSKYKKELNSLISKGFESLILNKKEKSFLVPLAPLIPVIYYLPKVHKDPLHPPGRPIISGIDSITSRVGKYIDFFLQPPVRNMPTYLKDTKDVMKLLSNVSFQGDTIMATADVASLYTCIPHQRVIEAVHEYLKRDASLATLQVDFIIELLEFATQHNYFWFDGRFYLQQKGVAMGAKFAPSLANLFMTKWEEDIVYAMGNPQLLLWAQYIDNILLLWGGTPEDLTNFFSVLNTNDRGIVLTYESSKSKIHFLDLVIERSDQQFIFSTYFKPTDRNVYIPIDSCHHKSWPRSIPKSRFLRLRRNCTDIDTFSTQATVLKERFLEKGYSQAEVETNKCSRC